MYMIMYIILGDRLQWAYNIAKEHIDKDVA